MRNFNAAITLYYTLLTETSNFAYNVNSVNYNLGFLTVYTLRSVSMQRLRNLHNIVDTGKNKVRNFKWTQNYVIVIKIFGVK
jgi:hypothetical protein